MDNHEEVDQSSVVAVAGPGECEKGDGDDFEDEGWESEESEDDPVVEVKPKIKQEVLGIWIWAFLQFDKKI